MELVSTFAKRLKEAMELREIKARDIVQATGISKSNISGYLSGRCDPKRVNIYKISKFLNVTETWLMGFDCQRDLFSPLMGEVRRKIYLAVDEMNDEQLNKTLNFIQEYIVKWNVLLYTLDIHPANKENNQ